LRPFGAARFARFAGVGFAGVAPIATLASSSGSSRIFFVKSSSGGCAGGAPSRGVIRSVRMPSS
jgi:hypothetical protein